MPVPKIPLPRALSVSQIVDTHNIPKRTVIAAIERGDLKAEKMPGKTGAYLIKEAELNIWLTSRQEEAAS